MWPSPEPSVDLTDQLIHSLDRWGKTAAEGTVKQAVDCVRVCFLDVHVAGYKHIFHAPAVTSCFILTTCQCLYSHMLKGLFCICVFLKGSIWFCHCICRWYEYVQCKSDSAWNRAHTFATGWQRLEEKKRKMNLLARWLKTCLMKCEPHGLDSCHVNTCIHCSDTSLLLQVFRGVIKSLVRSGN